MKIIYLKDFNKWAVIIKSKYSEDEWDILTNSEDKETCLLDAINILIMEKNKVVEFIDTIARKFTDDFYISEKFEVCYQDLISKNETYKSVCFCSEENRYLPVYDGFFISDEDI